MYNDLFYKPLNPKLSKVKVDHFMPWFVSITKSLGLSFSVNDFVTWTMAKSCDNYVIKFTSFFCGSSEMPKFVGRASGGFLQHDLYNFSSLIVIAQGSTTQSLEDCIKRYQFVGDLDVLVDSGGDIFLRSFDSFPQKLFLDLT